MPEICRFYGIVIKMFINARPPPHFHAEYGEYEGVININTVAVITGKLPSRALGLVIEWTSIHQDELRELWEKAQNHETLDRLEPLP